MAVKDKSDEDLIEWNVENEVQLFQAMRGHKPVGVNRYFQMACIHEKLSYSLNKEITSQVIWDKLDTMYDMAALHESEIIPFPNDESDFSLPINDFGVLLVQKQGSDLIDPIPITTKAISNPTPKIENKTIKIDNNNQDIKSKSGKEIYNTKGKNEISNPPKSVKTESVGLKTPKTETNLSSSSKSNTNKVEPASNKSSQISKSIPKEPISNSRNGKQDSTILKSSKDNSLRHVKSETVKKLDTSTSKSHKSDSSQSSKSHVKEKGAILRGERSEASSSKKNSDMSRSSRESSKSRNNNDSSSDDMPLSSVTKTKKPEENLSKRKRPSRNNDTKGNSPNISMSKRRRN